MHPILLTVGPFELYTYGALLAVAFLLGIYLATREAKRVGLSAELIADIGIVVILSAIVGARLFYIVFYDLQYTIEHPGELLKLRQTGLVFYGGFIFGIGSSLIYCRLKRAPIRLVLDVAAPSIAIGQAVGRIGCLMSGCCYGKPGSVPWAIKLPLLEHTRHPTQIYESIGAFGIFLVLMWFRKRKTADGQVIWLYVAMYAVLRLVLEAFRGDNPQILLGLTISQIISALVFLAAATLAFFVWVPSRDDRAHAGTGKSR